MSTIKFHKAWMVVDLDESIVYDGSAIQERDAGMLDEEVTYEAEGSDR